MGVMITDRLAPVASPTIHCAPPSQRFANCGATARNHSGCSLTCPPDLGIGPLSDSAPCVLSTHQVETSIAEQHITKCT